MDKIRSAIFNGLLRRTEKFNRDTFPQQKEDWTPEQLEIFKFLNGESGGITRLNESDRPEISKTLARIAGIEDLMSRHTITTSIEIPAYTIIVPRKSTGSITAGYPVIADAFSSLHVESGAQVSDLQTQFPVNDLRPATLDDVRTISEKYPENQLSQLYGAIDFPSETKLRKAIVETIHRRTQEFEKTLKGKFPDGIDDKSKKILCLGLTGETLSALAEILNNEYLTKRYEPPPKVARFKPYVAIYHTSETNGMSYQLNTTHIQADVISEDVFFSTPTEDKAGWLTIGNHADKKTSSFRTSTLEEIKQYIHDLPSEYLMLYARALTSEQVIGMI